MLKNIKDIDINNSSSWEDHVFLTFDTDWAHDEVLDYTARILKKYNAPSTWFITHNTQILDSLRQNSIFELGLHPNFNPLLEGKNESRKTAENVLNEIFEIVPEAVSVRSHSMTQNSRLLSLFAEKNLRFDCNHFIPHQSGIELAPWPHWDNITKVPYFWEDDVACSYNDEFSARKALSRNGLKVFDFHPIHVFLNTESLDRYEESRPYHHDPEKLKDFRNTRIQGTQDFLIELLEELS